MIISKRKTCVSLLSLIIIMSNYCKENLRGSLDLSTEATSPAEEGADCMNVQQYEVRIGKYKYDEQDELGTGFSSHVYKGVEILDPHKRYAIKVISLKKFRGQKLELLETEIEIHRSLNHENIVKLHQVIKTSNNYYLILEYCPHGSLNQYIHQKKQLTEANSIQIMKQLMSAYKYLLEEGILHRDIKPANILRLGKKWKLADFGFAVRSRLGFKDRSNMGTPLYMAPQSIKRSFYSYKSDFYSLGVVLYQMIVGQTPNEVDNEKQLMNCLENEVVLPKDVKNTKIVQFIHKACRLSDSKRIGREEFKSFIFDDSNTGQSLKQSMNLSTSMSLATVKISSTTTDSKNSISKQTQEQCILDENNQQSCKSITFDCEQPKISKSPMVVNSQLLTYQLEYVHHYYYAVQNIDSFHLESPTKQIFSLVLFKLLLKVLRQLCDKDRNLFQLDNWEQYRQCKLHQEMQTLFMNYLEKYEKEFLQFIKYNDIKAIRAVNRRFPELSKDSALTSKFYENLKIFLTDVIKEHRSWLEQQSEGNSYLNDGYEALQSVCSIYRLSEVRSSSPTSILKQKLNLVQDYTKSTRSKIHSHSSSLMLSL